MSLITSKPYHDSKLINYINNLAELPLRPHRKLMGIFYNKDHPEQSNYYNYIKNQYNDIITIDLTENLNAFKLIICLDDKQFDLIEQCYAENILIVSNYQSEKNETALINQYCIRYSNEKKLLNIIDIMNSEDTFSIIIPVYNCENYLEKTILSILCQTYSNYKIYIIDDCSTDNSLAVAKKYSHLPNVFITSNETNIGKFMSINTVLPKIDTDYYLIVDSDDLITKNRLIYDLIHFTKYKKILVVASKWYRYNETTNLSIREPYFCPNNCSFRTAIVNKIGLYWNTRFSGDSEYFDRFYKFIGKRYIIYVPVITCIAIHRTDNNNLTLQIPLGSQKRLAFHTFYKKYHDDVYVYNLNLEADCISEIFNKRLSNREPEINGLPVFPR